MTEQATAEGTLILESDDGAYYAVPHAVLEQHRIPQDRWAQIREVLDGDPERADLAGFHYSPIHHFHASDFPLVGSGLPSTPLSQRITQTLPEIRARGWSTSLSWP